MVEPWPCGWSMAGCWLVRTGLALSDQLSFPADEEAKARLVAAAPLLREALRVVERDRTNCNGRVLELHAPMIRAALAACEPTRETN